MPAQSLRPRDKRFLDQFPEPGTIRWVNSEKQAWISLSTSSDDTLSRDIILGLERFFQNHAEDKFVSKETFELHILVLPPSHQMINDGITEVIDRSREFVERLNADLKSIGLVPSRKTSVSGSGEIIVGVRSSANFLRFMSYMRKKEDYYSTFFGKNSAIMSDIRDVLEKHEVPKERQIEALYSAIESLKGYSRSETENIDREINYAPEILVEDANKSRLGTATNPHYNDRQGGTVGDIEQITKADIFARLDSVPSDKLPALAKLIDDFVSGAKEEITAHETTARTAEQPRPEIPATAAQVFAEAAAKSSRRKTRHVFTEEQLRDPELINRARDTLADAQAARRAGQPGPDRDAVKWADALLRRVRQLNPA